MSAWLSLTHTNGVCVCVRGLSVAPTWQDGEALLKLAANLRRAQRAAVGLHNVIWKREKQGDIVTTRRWFSYS